MNKIGSATFSPCQLYRYSLERKLSESSRRLLFILLNPSKADEYVNDNTVSRCINFGTEWGFGLLTVCNIFAFRSTDPKALKQNLRLGVDPIGVENNAAILTQAQISDLIICGWGRHGSILDRGKQVTNLLITSNLGDKLYYLKLCQDGTPGHPLYLKNNTKAIIWDMAAEYGRQ